MKADLAQLEDEALKARADQRAKLRKKIDHLQARIDAQQTKATLRFAAFAARQKVKHDVLENDAAAAGSALKRRRG